MKYCTNLWEKFRLGKKAKDYRTVFRGNDFALGCAKPGKNAQKDSELAEQCTQTRTAWKWS